MTAPQARARRRALVIWIALMLLLALTVSASFVPLGGGNALVSGVIALAKASLVLAFFMDFRGSINLIRAVAMIAAVTMALLFILSGLDYLTRIRYPSPWQFTPPSLYMESVDSSTETGRD